MFIMNCVDYKIHRPIKPQQPSKACKLTQKLPAMGVVDFAVHLLNFASPALVVALLVTFLARFIFGNQAAASVWYTRVAINFVVSLVALLAGLWYFGRDGTIASYTAMVLGCATSQWWMLRKI
jgi:hypothetical protein